MIRNLSRIVLAMALTAATASLHSQEPTPPPPPPEPVDQEQQAQQADLEIRAQQVAQAREEADAGQEAFSRGSYSEAIEHLRNALALDDSLFPLKIQIAQALARQYKVGDQDPENLRIGQAAVSEYQGIIQQDPRHLQALKELGTLLTQMGNLPVARETYKQLLEITPDNAEIYFLLGALDWSLAYSDTERRKAEAGLKADEVLDRPEDQKLCDAITTANQSFVNEGIKVLLDGIKIEPGNESGLSYLALLYRRAADLACDNREARARNLKLSQEWADKALARSKKQPEGPAPRPR